VRLLMHRSVLIALGIHRISGRIICPFFTSGTRPDYLIV
jgi:hypothetical protein